jgi:hypothetical protein
MLQKKGFIFIIPTIWGRPLRWMGLVRPPPAASSIWSGRFSVQPVYLESAPLLFFLRSFACLTPRRKAARLPNLCSSVFLIPHSPFFIPHSPFFILHSSFFILHSSFFILLLCSSALLLLSSQLLPFFPSSLLLFCSSSPLLFFPSSSATPNPKFVYPPEAKNDH